MNRWHLQDAKARFSELIRESAKAPQVVSRHGNDEAVILSMEEYRRLVGAKPDLISFMHDSPFFGAELRLERDTSGLRDVKL